MLTLLLTSVLFLYGDVIYLSDGNILLVEKAWEEGDSILYPTRKGIQRLAKAKVRAIKQEKPLPAASMKRWSALPEPNTPAGGVPEPPPPMPAASTAVSHEALARLRANWSANPSDKAATLELAHALNAMASLQGAQGDFAAAQRSLEEALSHFREDPALLSNLATIHFRTGDYGKAEDLLRACLRVDPDNQWAHLLLGETYYRQEKNSQAIRQWSEGLRLGPNAVIADRLEKARRELNAHENLRALTSQHFLLRYDRKGTSYPLGDQILAALEEIHRRLSHELTAHAPETVAVILYPDREFFDITRAPSWAGGVFDGKIRIPIKGLYSVTSALRAALAHELTHCFMLALPGRGSPGWFLEGVAQIQEGRSAASHRKWLLQLWKARRILPLKNLEGSFIAMPEDTIDLAYAESLAATEYLTARFGRAAIPSLLDLLAQNYSFDAAFTAAFKQSVDAFEEDWQRSLAD